MDGLVNLLDRNKLSLDLFDITIPTGGYVISRYVYWYIKLHPSSYTSCYQAWLLKTFIEWTLTNTLAKDIAYDYGWVIPPTSVSKLIFTKLNNEMKCYLLHHSHRNQNENDDVHEHNSSHATCRHA